MRAMCSAVWAKRSGVYAMMLVVLTKSAHPSDEA